MFVATHTIIGAVIGAAFPNHPVVAFIGAFVGHFLTDMIPHGDTKLYRDHLVGSRKLLARIYLIGDIVVAVGIIAYLLQQSIIQTHPTIAIGILGSVLPDLIVGLYEAFKWKWTTHFHRLHFFFHNFISSRTGDLPLYAGVVMELGITSLLFFRLV